MKRFTQDPPPQKGIDHKGQPDKPAETPPADAPKKEAAAPPPEPKPEPKTPTPEEAAAEAKLVIDTMFPGPGDAERKAKERAEKPAAPVIDPVKPPKEEPPKKNEEPAGKVELEPKKEEKPAAKPLPPPITEAISKDDLTPPPTPKPDAPAQPPAETPLDDEDQERLDGLARMEAEGTAPKGIIVQTQAFWEAEDAYIAAWEKENPGDTFNADALEHADFYANHEPAYDEKALKKAIKANFLESVEKSVIEKQEKKRAERELEQKAKDHAPKVATAINEAMAGMIADAGFKDIIEVDGKLKLDDAAYKALEAESPAINQILLEEAEPLAIQIREIENFREFGAQYQNDPSFAVRNSRGEHILPHRMLSEFTRDLEAEMANLPPEKTVRDGKRFVTHREYMQQCRSIYDSKGTEEQKQDAVNRLNENYYTIAYEDLKRALVVKYSNRATARIEQIGGRKKAPASATPPQTPPKKEAGNPPPTPTPTVKAPSLSPSDSVDTSKKPSSTGVITEQQVVTKFFG